MSIYCTIPQHKWKHGETLECMCPIDKGNEASDLPVEYKGHLNEAFRTHEPFAVSDFVNDIIDKIHIGKSVELLRQKSYAHKPLEELFNVQVAQTQIKT